MKHKMVTMQNIDAGKENLVMNAYERMLEVMRKQGKKIIRHQLKLLMSQMDK